MAVILLLVCLVASCAIGAAINYFLQTGPWRAWGYGLIAVGAFLFFFATGLWEGASRHDWGPLAPVFALFLIGGFLCVKFGKRAWDWWQKRNNSRDT